MPDSEAQVVRWLVEHLVQHGFRDGAVDPNRLVVDRDPDYVASSHSQALKSYYGRPRVAGRRADVLFAIRKSQRDHLVAVEVKKSSRQYEKGIAQTAEYRRGAHDAYLCIPDSTSRIDSGLRFSAEAVGGGILRADSAGVEIAVPPATLTPHPKTLRTTERYLHERRIERAFCLNYPLNYVAALMSTVRSSSPENYLKQRWGLSGGSVHHAFTGAETLGLISGDAPTHMGRAYARTFSELGFNFDEHKKYSYKGRLVKYAPGIAALLRAIYQQLDATHLVTQTLRSFKEGSADLTTLALRAGERDEGTALALFGQPDPDDTWYPTPTTVHQFKQALWHTGILCTKMADGAENLEKNLPETYQPDEDEWTLDPRVLDE